MFDAASYLNFPNENPMIENRCILADLEIAKLVATVGFIYIGHIFPYCRGCLILLIFMRSEVLEV